MSLIADRIKRVKERINQAATRAGVDPGTITLVAVSKTQPAASIEEALAAGIIHIGENRVQEALEKFERIGERAVWHMVGHLQTNKVRHAVRIFQMIHSVDSLRLGEEIHRRCVALGKRMPVLIQVKTSGEASKSGVESGQALDLAERLASMSGLSVQGLMTMPAFTPDPNDARPAFRMLRDLRARIESARIPGVDMRYLSMGMTHDFEAAIEEGANMIRVGTAIFGAR